MPRIIRNIIYYIAVVLLVGVFYIKFGSALAHRIIKAHQEQPKRYELEYGLEKSNQKFDIFIASSLDRVFQDGKTLLKPDFTESASLSLAGNEYESFQVIVSANKEAIKAVKIEISDFINPENQNMISSQNITSRVVGYVKTKKPDYPVKFVGMWPDPLLPNQVPDVGPGSMQPFWVTVYAPGETPGGVYKGTIKVLSEGHVLREIPASVRVYDFTLSREGHLKTAFDLYPQLMEGRYPRRDDEAAPDHWQRLKSITEAYYIDMLQHRINPMLNINPLSEDELGRIDTYRMHGLNNFSIGSRGGSFDNNWPNSDVEIENLLMDYRSYGENLKLNKMIEMSYIYAWDEGDIGNPRVQKICSMIHRAYPELKTMVCYMGIWDSAKDPDWGKDIDVWCFQIDHFDEAKIKALEKLKKEIWMYVSEPGEKGSPSLDIDADSIEYRIVPWLCWKYGFKGYLYWCVNYWPYFDPFKNAMNTKWEQNGNGLLYYPGEEGPIDSMRLEVLRDGMEDYEYLYLLDDRVKALKEKGMAVQYQKQIAEAEKLLKIDKEMVVSLFNYTKDSRFFLSYRDRVGELIEEMGKGLSQNEASR